MHWFDAHLDLAHLAQNGRDMTLPLDQLTAGPKPAAITLPSLAQGDVHWALATIYADPGSPGQPGGYGGAADIAGAHAAGLAQLRIYQDWDSRGLVRIVRRAGDLQSPENATRDGPLRIILLMEGADPIQSPDEAEWWFGQGLRAVGLAWRRGTRYAGGDSSPTDQGGLTDVGRDLVQRLDRLGIIHDLSHLHDTAARQLLDLTTGPVVVTHTTSRRLQGVDRHRFISDELIVEVARRGGMIGLALYSRFLAPAHARATIVRTIDHAEHIAQVMGRRDAIGLGSDMDGGFSAAELPEGIDRPADLGRLTVELKARGWTEGEIAGFHRDNWLRYMAEHLPGNG